MPDSLPPIVAPQNCHGLWRDGQQLVIKLRNHEFPCCCIKTNTTGDVAWFDVAADPTSLLVSGFRVTLGLLEGGQAGVSEVVRTVADKTEDKVQLRLPVSSRWHSRWENVGKRGWTIIAISVAGGILSVGGYIGLTMSGVGASRLVGMLAGPTAMILMGSLGFGVYGAATMFAKQPPIFTVAKTTPDFLWANGVDGGFLAQLPEWNESTLTSASPGA